MGDCDEVRQCSGERPHLTEPPQSKRGEQPDVPVHLLHVSLLLPIRTTHILLQEGCKGGEGRGGGGQGEKGRKEVEMDGEGQRRGERGRESRDWRGW